MPYSHEERAKARMATRRLEALAAETRACAERGLILAPDKAQTVAAITSTYDLNAQTHALSAIAEQVQRQHIDRLVPLAVNDFSAYCEVVNPEEPPESPWHLWLTDQLQQIEFDPERRKFALNCPPGHAKPLHVDTPVLMADGGYKRLGDIVVGDEVISGEGFVRRVTAVHEQGVLPLVKITTQAGRQVRSALDHPFRVDKGFTGPKAQRKPTDNLTWVDAGDLLPDMALAVEAGFFACKDLDLFIEDGEAELIGWMCLAGALSYQKQPRLKNPSPDFRLSTTQRVRAKALTELCAGIKAHLQVTVLKTSGPKDSFVMRLATPDFRRLGEPWFTLDPLTRRVNPELFTCDSQTIAKFMTGAFSARGEVIRKHPGRNIRLAHRSVAMLEDIQALCARLGVASQLDRGDPDFGGTPKLDFDDAAIGYILAETGIELDAVLRAALDEQKPLGPRTPQQDVNRDPVFSVEPDGVGECRCLTVEVDHSFTASGVVVRNSTYASRLFVSWRLGRNPNHRIIGGGHGQVFVENEFSKKIRDLVATPDYHRVFPDLKINHKTSAAGQWAIAGKKGQYVARGMGQGVHGFRATFICIDDPYSKLEDAQSPTYRRKCEDWFFKDMGSRLIPGGKIFLIMTRFHAEDLTGVIKERNKTAAEYAKWEVVSVPAVCYDPSTDIMRRNLGDVLWSIYDHNYFSQSRSDWGLLGFALTYQQIDTASNPDNIASHFNYYKQLPHLEPKALEGCILDQHGRPIPRKSDFIRRTVVSVDSASKTTERADYTVVQVWMESHSGKHYLVHQDRKKVEFNDLITMIEAPAIRYGADVILVEDKGSGMAYIQNRAPTGGRRLAPAPVVGINPGNEGKAFRLDLVAPLIAEGVVYLPEPADAPWVDMLMTEFGQFPDGAHDDQVDALSQYLAYAKSQRRRFGARKIGGMG